jgi:hypothetical protein
MVTPDDAALLTRVTARAIYLMVEAGEIHFVETREGLVLICPRSLMKTG